MEETTDSLQDDIELIQRISQGDRKSFAKFYEKFSGAVFGTALRVLNDPRDAEDVAQEVFVMVWEKAALFNSGRGKPITWLITMTRNKSIDRLRSLQRKFRLQDEMEEEAMAVDFTTDRAPASDLETHERDERLRDAVGKLGREQRQVIELAYFGGLTQIEIAGRLGQPLGTIKARIRRGLFKLRRLVAGIESD